MSDDLTEETAEDCSVSDEARAETEVSHRETAEDRSHWNGVEDDAEFLQNSVTESEFASQTPHEELKRLDPEDVDDRHEEIVTVEVAVDARGATEEQLSMYHEMAEMVEENFRLFVEKNRDYGSSFVTGGEVEQAMGGHVFEDAQRAAAYQLLTRIYDKKQRIYNLLYGEEDVRVDETDEQSTSYSLDSQGRVGETVHETALDMANYALMLSWLVDPHTSSGREVTDGSRCEQSDPETESVEGCDGEDGEETYHHLDNGGTTTNIDFKVGPSKVITHCKTHRDAVAEELGTMLEWETAQHAADHLVDKGLLDDA